MNFDFLLFLLLYFPPPPPPPPPFPLPPLPFPPPPPPFPPPPPPPPFPPPPPLPAVDTTKDPCQKVKCSRHKICVAQGYQRAMCVNVNRKRLEHRSRLPVELMPHENTCKPCPVAAASPVCGTDRHNYASQVL
uniref:Kazal-like domain-containing protein n=1 Tax=Hucho hucho TaxID=62062 RepID=A0A4W5PWD5_9TELE